MVSTDATGQLSGKLPVPGVIPHPDGNHKGKGGVMSDERSKMVENAILQIEKTYGKGSIMRLGNKDVLVPVSVIPTGAASLDEIGRAHV